MPQGHDSRREANNVTETTEDLSDYSKSELQAKADELGVDYTDSDTKAELIAAINEAEEPDDDGDDEETTDEEAADDEEVAPISTVGTFDSEAFPQMAPIEPDLADVPTDPQEGEFMAPLNGESWVVLDGAHDEVDDRWDGKIAAVLAWPTVTEQDPDTGEVKSFLPPDAHLTVQERSQGLRMYLPLDAFKEIHTNGRGAVQEFA